LADYSNYYFAARRALSENKNTTHLVFGPNLLYLIKIISLTIELLTLHKLFESGKRMLAEPANAIELYKLF